MSHLQQYPPHGVVGRHEETFNDVLYAQIKRTPWWLLSISVHAALILVMWGMSFSVGRVEENITIAIGDEGPVMDKLQTEEPETEIIEPIETEDPPIVDPTIDHESVFEENPNPNPTREPNPEPGPVGPFEGDGDNVEIGIGGSARGGGDGFRRRRELRAAGSSNLNRSVDLALDWLANHQNEAGYWDCDGFAEECKGNRCGGAGHALYDPGVTGLALLTFLATGDTHRQGRYRKVISRGLRYLKQIQDPEGCFGPRTASKFTYNTAVATLAMTEAYGLTGSPLFKQSAQSGIDFLIKCQNPYLGWRYGVRPQDNDTSVMGWVIMALKSAKLAGGLRVPEEGFAGAKAWLEKVTEPEYGKVGYMARGTGVARPQDLMDRFPSDKSEAMTAVGILSRIFLGEDPRRSEMIRKGTALCLRTLPEWDDAGGSIDQYYWYYGSLALFQVGGEAWKSWRKAMESAIVDNQRKGGCERGSWDPLGPWGREGGRVYSTALCAMCLQVYYRYPRAIIGRERR